MFKIEDKVKLKDHIQLPEELHKYDFGYITNIDNNLYTVAFGKYSEDYECSGLWKSDLDHV